MEIPKSTVRFAQVVKECGRPEPVTLWTDPKKDPDFQAANRQQRIMTVIQETVGAKKDFGLVGFHRSEHASYWKFPKPLGDFGGKRVIGIKYDMLNVPKPKDPVSLTAEPAKKASPKDREKPITEQKATKEPARKPSPDLLPEKPEPKLHRYRVIIRAIATTENAREIEATSAKEAEELALNMAAGETVAFTAGETMRKVTGVRRL
jgi:hypothetical protein